AHLPAHGRRAPTTPTPGPLARGARRGGPEAAAARAELRLIGTRGIKPLLEALADQDRRSAASRSTSSATSATRTRRRRSSRSPRTRPSTWGSACKRCSPRAPWRRPRWSRASTR
ncbi:MAG: hypothetical protein M5U28_35480, partial [Sandaracinaceae bacterium]|nr:hypothetical protein [Sandaracinaceae bacterium]